LKTQQVNSYYPFGMNIKGLSANGSATYKPNEYLYNGKMMQDEMGLGLLDYGARFYDAVLGRWHLIDGKSELYWNVSPYVYALNTPINAIDPNGHIVVFINGNHFGDGGKAEYWRQYTNVITGYKSANCRYGAISSVPQYERRESLAFDQAVMDQVGDQKAIYRDGSLGGWVPLNIWAIALDAREEAGHAQGERDAAYLISNIRDSDGNIVESIKIITHSMGGGYGKGYARAILEYAKAHNISGVIIAFEADFANFQSKRSKCY